MTTEGIKVHCSSTHKKKRESEKKKVEWMKRRNERIRMEMKDRRDRG